MKEVNKSQAKCWCEQMLLKVTTSRHGVYWCVTCFTDETYFQSNVDIQIQNFSEVFFSENKHSAVCFPPNVHTSDVKVFRGHVVGHGAEYDEFTFE